MQFITSTDPTVPAQALALEIQTQLSVDRPVLWLLSGGSSVAVAVATAQLLTPHPKLTITLVDERYGQPGHADSNYQHLLDAGFNLPIIPVLTGKEEPVTTMDFDHFLQEHQYDYSLGIFGIGADGHTAGILPGSDSAQELEDLAYAYPSEPFLRITITKAAIARLARAYVWAIGPDKWPQLERLTMDVPPSDQPAQYLKLADDCLIYSDFPYQSKLSH